jgi:uncharacterized protein YcaQ
MLDVVSDVCGVHAQVASSAELQLWARVEGLKQQHVRKALWERRSLVRTWAMRGTLHLLTAADLPLYVAALRTHDRWWKGAWLKFIGMREDELRALLDTTRESLGARPLTRAELAKKVAARAGSAAGDRMLSNWGEMLKPAAFHGWLISGPPRGQNVTFVRPDRWLATWKEPTPEAAWRAIVRRYLRVYGPATREEFGRWWGMQAAPAGRILTESADELVEVDVEGRRSWARPEDVPEMPRSSIRGAVRLLPAFDVYTTGARPQAVRFARVPAGRVGLSGRPDRRRRGGSVEPRPIGRSHRRNGRTVPQAGKFAKKAHRRRGRSTGRLLRHSRFGLLWPRAGLGLFSEMNAKMTGA